EGGVEEVVGTLEAHVPAPLRAFTATQAERLAVAVMQVQRRVHIHVDALRLQQAGADGAALAGRLLRQAFAGEEPEAGVGGGLVGGEGVGPEHVPGGVDGHGVQAAEAHVDADPHVGKSMEMQRLTGLDATFLYLETPSIHMHVASTAVFDPSTVPGGYSFERV